MLEIIKGIICPHCGDYIKKELFDLTPHDLFLCDECGMAYENEKEAILCHKKPSEQP